MLIGWSCTTQQKIFDTKKKIIKFCWWRKTKKRRPRMNLHIKSSAIILIRWVLRKKKSSESETKGETINGQLHNGSFYSRCINFTVWLFVTITQWIWMRLFDVFWWLTMHLHKRKISKKLELSMSGLDGSWSCINLNWNFFYSFFFKWWKFLRKSWND